MPFSLECELCLEVAEIYKKIISEAPFSGQLVIKSPPK